MAWKMSAKRWQKAPDRARRRRHAADNDTQLASTPNTTKTHLAHDCAVVQDKLLELLQSSYCNLQVSRAAELAATPNMQRAEGRRHDGVVDFHASRRRGMALSE